jgi:D-alanine-D-alanine ligase
MGGAVLLDEVPGFSSNSRTEAQVLLAHGPYGNNIRAAILFNPGDTIFRLTGEILSYPTKYTIQLNEFDHVLTQESHWKSVNHSCDPNVRIDTLKREMVAARRIEPGEELNFNYNTTEWSMTSPFPCGCGAACCAGEIRGFRFLSDQQRESIRPLLSPYIAELWNEMDHRSGQSEITVRELRPEVHLLIPYMIKDGQAVSPDYDLDSFRAELSDWFKPLGLRHVWHSVTIPTINDVILSLASRANETAIVVLNLCDGLESDGYPGMSMIDALGQAGLPYSGAGARFYEVTTSKLATKRMLRASGISTADFAIIKDPDRDLAAAMKQIGSPLFIKPDISAGSYGVGLDSVCYDLDAARAKVEKLRADEYFLSSDILAESFIDGREFTVLVIEDPTQPLGLFALHPGERVFNQSLPTDQRLLAHDRYWGLPEENRPIPIGEPYYWYQPAPEYLKAELEQLARRAVRAIDGNGYARVDIRQSEKQGTLYVLEVNAQCGLSTDSSSTVGSLLNISGRKMPEIMERVLNHALSRGARSLNAREEQCNC